MGTADLPAAPALSQMKMLDSDNARLGRELAELQGRLALGERAEKESRREALGLRQRLVKGEASLETLRQEVSGEMGGLPAGGGDSGR
jgi:rootletin